MRKTITGLNACENRLRETVWYITQLRSQWAPFVSICYGWVLDCCPPSLCRTWASWAYTFAQPCPWAKRCQASPRIAQLAFNTCFHYNTSCRSRSTPSTPNTCIYPNACTHTSTPSTPVLVSTPSTPGPAFTLRSGGWIPMPPSTQLLASTPTHKLHITCIHSRTCNHSNVCIDSKNCIHSILSR